MDFANFAGPARPGRSLAGKGAVGPASPTNRDRTAGIDPRVRLEGFPLLHLDFYKEDPAGLSWPAWIEANALERTAPERGMRFQRITAALGAVLANAGISLCGLALLADDIEQGTVALPYGASTGLWGEHAFTARLRADSAARRHVARFRSWLADESRATAARLARIAGTAPARTSR